MIPRAGILLLLLWLAIVWTAIIMATTEIVSLLGDGLR
jgi:hypothetical protein